MSSSARRILIVDDDEHDVEFFRRGFADFAHVEVLSTHNPHDAESIAADAAVDMIVVDLKMPGRNGDEVASALRKDPRFTTKPIVVCSTSANPDDVQRCYAAGANSYCPKPASLAQYKALARDLSQYWFVRSIVNVD